MGFPRWRIEEHTRGPDRAKQGWCFGGRFSGEGLFESGNDGADGEMHPARRGVPFLCASQRGTGTHSSTGETRDNHGWEGRSWSGQMLDLPAKYSIQRKSPFSHIPWRSGVDTLDPGSRRPSPLGLAFSLPSSLSAKPPFSTAAHTPSSPPYGLVALHVLRADPRHATRRFPSRNPG